MTDLYHRFEGYEDVKGLVDRSDEDVLVALAGKPALIRIPGTSDQPRARVLSCLLHGNEDSGYRAVLGLLRRGERFTFDLWVFIGNVRAASTDGWFAHRYLDDQEDFNRVWGVDELTTRMRRCAALVLAELKDANLEAAVDLHNNTGDNPFYAILPEATPAALRLAGVCADTVLLWGLRANTFMEALIDWCPAIAVECGLPGIEAHSDHAARVVERFVAAEVDSGSGPTPPRVFEMQHRVEVRPEVSFAVGGALTDEIDLVLRPGLDGDNFGMLLAGTVLGHVFGGSAMPLVARDMHGRDVTKDYVAVNGAGELVTTQDVTPVMMTTTVRQIRRDCLFYICRRRS